MMSITLVQSARRDVCYLRSVVSRVTELLESGGSVSLRGRDDAYDLPVWGVRITGKSKMLQVDTVFGWVTVWGTERLADEFGECLYCSPNYYELEEGLM